MIGIWVTRSFQTSMETVDEIELRQLHHNQLAAASRLMTDGSHFRKPSEVVPLSLLEQQKKQQKKQPQKQKQPQQQQQVVAEQKENVNKEEKMAEVAISPVGYKPFPPIENVVLQMNGENKTAGQFALDFAILGRKYIVACHLWGS
jgi:hypothetical protein